VLDFGSNSLAYSNIINKIDCKKYSFNVYDPFYNNEKFPLPFKVSYFKDPTLLKKNSWDMVNFGSSIQYLKNLNTLKNINFTKTNLVSITHTPINLKRSYSEMQTNHKSLRQNIYSLSKIKKIFYEKKFKLIFKSRNDDNLSVAKNKKDTYLLNLVFSK